MTKPDITLKKDMTLEELQQEIDNFIENITKGAGEDTPEMDEAHIDLLIEEYFKPAFKEIINPQGILDTLKQAKSRAEIMEMELALQLRLSVIMMIGATAGREMAEKTEDMSDEDRVVSILKAKQNKGL